MRSLNAVEDRIDTTLRDDLRRAAAEIPSSMRIRLGGPGDSNAIEAFISEHVHPLGLGPLASGKWAPHRRGPRPAEVLIEGADGLVAVAWTEAAEIMGADPFGEEHAVLGVVAPQSRRRRLGTILMEVLEREAARRGAQRLVSATTEDDEAGLAFLARRGFRPFSRRGFWSIDLELFDEHRFAPAAVLAERAGVRLLSYREAEDVLGPSLHEAVRLAHVRALADMLPLGDGLSIGPDRYARIFLAPDRLDADASTIALVDGEVVGVALAERSGSDVNLPIVAAHGRARARRVPLALKLRTLARLRRSGAVRVVLVNDPDNAPTRRVLRSLGFVAAPVVVRLDRRLRGAGAITTI